MGCVTATHACRARQGVCAVAVVVVLQQTVRPPLPQDQFDGIIRGACAHSKRVSAELGISTTYLEDLLQALVIERVLPGGGVRVCEVKPPLVLTERFKRTNGRLLESVAAKSPVYGLSGDAPVNAALCAVLALAGWLCGACHWQQQQLVFSHMCAPPALCCA